MIVTLSVKTSKREELVDITGQVEKTVTDAGIESGLVTCYVPHTTAGVTINEAADPDVRRDIIYKLSKEIPQSEDYRHAEGNSDAHIKASLMGSSVQLFIDQGRLALGRWQGIYFCEFDGPRQRKLIIGFTPLA